jgi:predicted porin
MKKLALASLVAAATMATSAQAVTVMAEDGWTLGVSGQINQFFVVTDDDNVGDASEIRDGLLPAFINFDMTSPEINGLTMAAHVSLSPSTNGLAQGAGSSEQREAYATVSGSFGQVLIGKALGLYGSHNIVTEQTLFGVGWGTSSSALGTASSNLTTTLGGIGLGYDYADWRSQIKWTSPDMSGFKVALAVVDPQGAALITEAGATGPLSTVTGKNEEDTPRFEADLSYAGTFDGGSYSAWLSGAWQDHDTLAEDAQYWTVGGTLTVGGFEFMAQYSDAEDAIGANTSGFDAAATSAEWDQYVIQAGYRFGGTTLVSANYSELETDTNTAAESEADRVTVGIYHDVNANLKLVAEYTKVEHDNEARLDAESFSIGGFVFF